MNNRRKSAVTTAALLVTLAGVIFAAIQMRRNSAEPLFTAQARPVYLLPPDNGTTRLQEYSWISPTRLLMLQTYGHTGQAYTVDTVSGEKTILDGINQQLKGTQVVELSPGPSPNGDWILFRRYRMQGDSDTFATSLDGTRRFEWKESAGSMTDQSFSGPPLWESDNSHWLEFKESRNLAGITVVRHGISEKNSKLAEIAIAGIPIGLDSRGNLIAVDTEYASVAKHRLLTYDVTTGKQVGELTVPLPEEAAMLQVAISSQRTRIAFVIQAGGRPLYPGWLGRLFPAIARQRTPRRFSLWLCGMDGTHLHELGYCDQNQDLSGLTDLKWLPDGSGVSVVYKAKVWLIPAH